MKNHNTPPALKGNILLIWDRMGDYHRARWEELQKAVTDQIVYAADLGRGDSLYKWETTAQASNYIQLTNELVDAVESRKAVSLFLEHIKEKNIRYVCIPGYGRQAYLYMLIVSRIKGLRVLLFAESWYPGSATFDRLKGKVLNLLVDAFFVSGVRAERHFYKRLQIPVAKIIKGYSVVDNAHFKKEVEYRDYKNKELLCIARYSKEKNLLLLIDAYISSNLHKNGWKLRLVGDGPQKEILMKTIASADASNHIFLDGWKSYQELPALYNRASCFILPSLFEPWGLVVNEAMAAALPVIVSNEVGCMPDLVNDENGWDFQADNVESLVKVFNTLCNTSDLQLAQKGGASAKRIKAFGLDNWVQQVLKGLLLM